MPEHERYGWRDEERIRWRYERHYPQEFSEDMESVPGHALHADLQQAMERMKIGLQQAIVEAKNAERICHHAFEGILLRQGSDVWVYQFSLKTLWEPEVNTLVFLEQPSGQRITARIVQCLGMKLLFSTQEPLPQTMLAQLMLTEESAWLLERQMRVINDYLQGSLQPAADLAEKVLGFVQPRYGTKKVKKTMGTFMPDKQQQQAIEHALGSEMTIIVGPGGTGKSAVEASATCHLLKQGCSILTISHTNIATDNVFLRQVQAIQDSQDLELLALLQGGRIVRAGAHARHQSLQTGTSKHLTVSAIAEQRMGTLEQERLQLEQTQRAFLQKIGKQKHHSPHRMKGGQRKEATLQQQIDSLDDGNEEGNAVVQTKKQDRHLMAGNRKNARMEKERAENEWMNTSLTEEVQVFQDEVSVREQELKAERWVVQQTQEEKAAIEARHEELERQLSETKRQIVKDAQLVATTATAVCFNSSLLHRDFDVVIIDEISMISMIAVVIAVLRAKKCVIVAGDPMQFAPIVKTECKNIEQELPELQEWVASDLLTYRKITIFDAIQRKKGCVLLTQQGRMHPKILAPLNHFVYQNMLTSRPETFNAPSIDPCPQWPLMVVDSSGSPESQVYKASKHQARVNEYHAQIALALVPQILSTLSPRLPSADPSVPRIGILTPYKSQVNLILRKARQAGLEEYVFVGTVNSVQALEFEVVIFDTVEAPTRQISGQKKSVLQPFSFTFDTILDKNNMATQATRLLTVVHSRARHKLIYLAHIDHLRRYQPLNPKDDPLKQRLLVDLVDWAANEGLIGSNKVLSHL